jgi:DNA (cytosine-5)-methyltransferase 1
LEDIKPFAFVMENVPGLSNGIGKPIFLQTLRKLNELGYHTVHAVLDSADFGIPQRRRRLVLMGTLLGNIRLLLPKQTNQNPDDKDRYLSPWITVKDVISYLPPIKAGEKSQFDPLHASANLSVLNIKRLQHTPPDGGDRTSWPEELILECHKKVNGYKDVYGRMRWNSPSPTMTGGCSMLSKGRFGHPEQHRAISLREAALFQTFPDNFQFTGTFSQIAEQIGNAVPPLLANKIAEALLGSIKDAEESEKIVSENIPVGINQLSAAS